MYEKHGLSFKRSDNYRLLKPAVILVLDFEALNTPTPPSAQSIYYKTPSSALYTQKIVSYAYVNRSLYPEFPLIDELQPPRFAFKNEDDPNGEKQFYLGLLLSLRNELELHHRHIEKILHDNRDPPPMRNRTTDTITKILSTSHCELCGALFNSKRKSKKSGRIYR